MSIRKKVTPLITFLNTLTKEQQKDLFMALGHIDSLTETEMTLLTELVGVKLLN